MGESTRGNPCSHHGTIVQRKRPAQRGARVGGQCTICRSAVGPQILVDRNSALATRAPVWLPKPKKSARAVRRNATYKTKHWRTLRLERLALDGYICQSCDGVATEVHHLPGTLYGAETLDGIISVCRSCNLEDRSVRAVQHSLGGS